MECYSDKYFINRLSPREKTIHAFCKGKVLEQIDDRSNVIGLIDADPHDPQPGLLRNYIRDELSNGLAILTRRGNPTNKIVELTPRFENWIIDRVRNNGLSMNQFGLPETPSELHKIKRIDKDQRYHRLIDSIIVRDPEMNRIKNVIGEVRE